jgi:hypothetical protein
MMAPTLILALRRQRQEDFEFEARPYLKKQGLDI